ncbi:MAG TPA: lactate utilization protein [Anaerovoracaceae bacterium]|nr:lactate utilization protein [Anaerovoracaceae bacterium]
MRETPKYLRYDKMGPRVAENFNKKGFEAYYVKTSEEALLKSTELIPKKHIVSWGGSMTISQIGLLDNVRKYYGVIDKQNAKDPMEAMKQSLHADTFLMGSNGASEDGQLVNIDGNGNRVAALCFGPSQVIVVIGLNKVKKDIEEAIDYARHYEAPMNCQRFEALNTPCNITGMCNDCNSDDCICNQILVTRRCKPKGRIKVIIVGEDLGL